jgi:hypothetical protein
MAERTRERQVGCLCGSRNGSQCQHAGESAQFHFDSQVIRHRKRQQKVCHAKMQLIYIGNLFYTQGM